MAAAEKAWPYSNVKVPGMVNPQNIEIGLKLTVSGMLIVFCVLALIALIVSVMRLLDRHWQVREAKQELASYDKAPTIDNTTLVLITAAVATVLTGRYRIRSIRRVSSEVSRSSKWSMQGRGQIHGSHVVNKHLKA